MTFSRNAFVNTLRGETGYREGRSPDGDWNNFQKYSPAVPGLEWSQNQAWCATFTSWGAVKTVTGVPARDLFPVTASCSTAVQWWKNHNRWTEYPVLGAPFYMGSSGQDHVGVVHAYDADFIYTVEGNTNTDGSYQGNGVYERKRPRRGTGSPYGYGIPKFDEATITADPAASGYKATASVPRITEPPKEAVVAISDDDARKIAKFVWAQSLKSPTSGEAHSAETFLRYADSRFQRQMEAVKAVQTSVERLNTLVGGMALEGASKAVVDAVKAELAQLRIVIED